jgi:hypothetical protein
VWSPSEDDDATRVPTIEGVSPVDELQISGCEEMQMLPNLSVFGAFFCGLNPAFTEISSC